MDKCNPKVAVVGAGLAGLTCGYRLAQANINVSLFEAKKRVGGRILTALLNNASGEKFAIELGGQNITDGGEARQLLNLTTELGLEIVHSESNTNQIVTASDNFEFLDKLIANHHKSLDDLIILKNQAEHMEALISLFCEDNLLLKQALNTRMTAYEGINTNQQSIYHNIETLKCMLSGGLAKEHEHYNHQDNQIVTAHVKGGNANLVAAMQEQLGAIILTGKVLQKVILNNESATLMFEDNTCVDYDYVVLAIPVMTYNQVDLNESGIALQKLHKIHRIGHGNNYKTAILIEPETNEYIYGIVNQDYLSFYNNEGGIQFIYSNGPAVDINDFVSKLSNVNHTKINLRSSQVTDAIDQQFYLYNSNVRYDWNQDKFTRGSYTSYSIHVAKQLDELAEDHGTIYKKLFLPINNTIFFAGEHTTILDCIGTMEAAVESGARVAKAILQVSRC